MVHVGEDRVEDEGESGNYVNDVHCFADESQFRGRSEKADGDLKSKPPIADAFDVEEIFVWFGDWRSHFPCCGVGLGWVGGKVAMGDNSKVLVSFEAK